LINPGLYLTTHAQRLPSRSASIQQGKWFVEYPCERGRGEGATHPEERQCGKVEGEDAAGAAEVEDF